MLLNSTPTWAQRAPEFAETFELSSDCHSRLGLGRLTAENVAPVRAAEVNGRALAKFEATDDAVGVADLLVTNGRINRFLGQPAAALADCQRALTASETYKGPEGRMRFVSALMCIGHSQLDLGDARSAVQTLERVTAALLPQDCGVRVDLEFTLARALVANHQDLARARALAQTALERLKPYPALTVERADIDAWLASPTAQPRRLR